MNTALPQVRIASASTDPDPLDARLAQLGFRAAQRGEVKYVIPPMRAIPAGPFRMGTARIDGQRMYEDEFPQHEVVTATFEIGAFPVTVAEYSLAVQASAVGTPQPFRGTTWSDQLMRPDHPVTSISWLDAMSYSLWLGDVTGELWTLPNEAEWEKAARGVDGRIYPWGNEWDPARANTPDGGFAHTTPIDTFPEGRSPFDVWDMVGNTWEWCSSIYRRYPYDQSDGRENLTIVADRVMRGSAWYCIPYNARVACRGIGYAGRYVGGGFRLVRHPLR